MTCDFWDTDYSSDNWEHEFMTIFVTWSRNTLDSIRNSCNVFITSLKKWSVKDSLSIEDKHPSTRIGCKLAIADFLFYCSSNSCCTLERKLFNCSQPSFQIIIMPFSNDISNFQIMFTSHCRYHQYHFQPSNERNCFLDPKASLRWPLWISNWDWVFLSFFSFLFWVFLCERSFEI